MDYGQLVMDNEFAGMIRHAVRGIPINDESLAVDVIREIGAFGHFLNHDHTFTHMRTEQTHPEFIDRRVREEWEKAGKTDIYQRAWGKARDILENHKPEPLPAEVLKKIRSIVQETEEELKIAKGKDLGAEQKDEGYRRAAG